MSRVVLVGGGLVGTALAAELAEQGDEIHLITDRGIGGAATAAGMGHLVALEGEASKVALTEHSLGLWETMELSDRCERDRCGTLWVAETDEEMDEASAQAESFAARGIDSELVEGDRLLDLEPELRRGLRGGLVVPSDSVVYPPKVAELLWHRAEKRGARRIDDSVASVEPGRVCLTGGAKLEADWVVIAAGDRTPALLPEIPIRPRKGHLLITARGPAFIRHQVVELGYGKTTESGDEVSIACNVQPRTTGQVLVGSSRQEDRSDSRVEPEIVESMLRRALHFLPGLARLTALRAWTGLRAATPDGLPVIGVLEPGLAVASGHEGLGITHAPGTARLLRQILAGERCEIDASPYDPLRFAGDAA